MCFLLIHLELCQQPPTLSHGFHCQVPHCICIWASLHIRQISEWMNAYKFTIALTKASNRVVYDSIQLHTHTHTMLEQAFIIKYDRLGGFHTESNFLTIPEAGKSKTSRFWPVQFLTSALFLPYRRLPSWYILTMTFPHYMQRWGREEKQPLWCFFSERH